MRDIMLEFIYNLDLLMFATLGVCFLIFLLFLLLGFLFKKSFLSKFCFFCAFIGLFSTPFVIALSSQNFLFKLEILENHSRPLVFSQSFLIDITIKNMGKLKIKKCQFDIMPTRAQNSLKNKLLDLLNPLPRISYTFYEKIKKKSIKHLEKILPYNASKKDFKFSLNCR
ncbi:DUF2393 family protein [Helicobacter anatolicus]|uniref:DUF2393 family protein n=1 Tax=Helicobacter anatolicus TaxID=2905874 RepID=UPI001E53B972|nr:DUF2393 family protein [Helicobacter anatolicus]MCE3038927.1 DUF2393 domain-containing protein [Helicobacter anatolicus]